MTDFPAAHLRSGSAWDSVAGEPIVGSQSRLDDPPVFRGRSAASLWASPRGLGKDAVYGPVQRTAVKLGLQLRVAPTSPSGVALDVLDAGELVVRQAGGWVTSSGIDLWVSNGVAFSEDVDVGLLEAVAGVASDGRARAVIGAVVAGGLLVPLRMSSRLRSLALYPGLCEIVEGEANQATLMQWWSESMGAVRDGVDMLSFADSGSSFVQPKAGTADMSADDVLQAMSSEGVGVASAWLGLAGRVLDASQRAFTQYVGSL